MNTFIFLSFVLVFLLGCVAGAWLAAAAAVPPKPHRGGASGCDSGGALIDNSVSGRDMPTAGR